MAVAEQTPYIEYTANGATTSFALGFYCESKDHLIVTMNGVEPLLTDWSLVDGAVVFAVAPINESVVVIQRNTPFARPVDYQTYNNSFRAPAVNNDFDRIWLKLQELGVTDWILGNRIDDLRAYVDAQDDALRATLMTEIQAQGISLDQLDAYYNYLMQRLAEIAVNRGWEASFVVDASGKTQQEINNVNQVVEDIAEMLAIATPQTGNRIYIKSYYTGLNIGSDLFVYDATKAAVNDGINIFNGWVREKRSTYLTSQIGVKPDVDCSIILNKLALYLTQNGGGKIVFDTAAIATSPILVPRYVQFDLNGQTVSGGGKGTNDVFKTATVVAGVLEANANKPDITDNMVFGASVTNGTIKDCNQAVDNWLALDNCNFDNLIFSNVTKSINYGKSWYSSYSELMSRTVTPIHYDLKDNVNASNFTNVSVVGGGKLDGGIGYKIATLNATSFKNVNAESVQTGIKSNGQSAALAIESGYFENSSVGIDLSDAVGKYGVNINSNYFNGVDVGIKANQLMHGAIGAGNYFVNCPTWIEITDNFSSCDVRVRDQSFADNVTTYSLASTYNITGSRVNVIGRDILYHSATGDLIASRPAKKGIVDLNYSGNIGVTKNGSVPFCNVSKTAGTTNFSIIIDTNITFDEYATYVFKFYVIDNATSSKIYGVGAGTDMISLTTQNSKTVIASNNAGMLRLTLGDFSHPTELYTCTGRIHII